MANKKTKTKRTSKQLTEFTLTCRCGAKARVFSIGEKGFTAHCPACGSVTFFRSTDLLERLKYGGTLCPHQIESKLCRGGKTSWCPVCRIRTFYPEVV
jgi:hypothetical protein